MDNITEAYRHLENAQEILSKKAKKEDNYYTDKKYVKMAGHTAYTGVLMALDAIMPTTKKANRRDVNDYRQYLAKIDKKALNKFNILYEQFHLSLGYDGSATFDQVTGAFKVYTDLVAWIERKI
jgi:hypothetical protein